MKTTREILQGGLLAIALAMTLGSILAPSVEAEAYECRASPGHVCVIRWVDEEDYWVFEDYEFVDEELE